MSQQKISFKFNLITYLFCQLFNSRQIKMLYPAAAASFSGIIMFILGKQMGEQSEKSNQKQRQQIQQKLRQKQVKAKQQGQLAQRQKQKLIAALATPKIKDTFFETAIQSPIVRLDYKHFKIVYSKFHKGPLAVHELINKQILQGDAQRRSFFTQKKLDQRFAATDDHFRVSKAYYNFYLARGHMAAAGNYGKKEDKDQTFTFANIIPQNQKNNGGIWNTFERYARSLLQRDLCKTLEIISGPIYSKDFPYIKNQETLERIFLQKSIVLLENGVTVPDKLYKIIKCNRQHDFLISGYLFENSSVKTNHKKLQDFQEPLQKIQNLTGLKFNIGLSDSKDPIVFQTPQQIKTQDQRSVLPVVNYKSLNQIDKQKLTKTKLDLDTEYFDNKIKSSKSLNELTGNFRRVSDQDLGFKYEQYQQLIIRLAQEKMNSLKQDKQTTQCGRLKNYMHFNKELQHFKIIANYQEQIKGDQALLIKPCAQSQDSKNKQIIQKMLQRRRKWFTYINNDQLVKQFSPQTGNKQKQSNN